MVDIRKFINHPFIKHQRHPSLPLTIFNYTGECQFQGAWDEYTVAARGLVLDDNGNVVARPFRKFFNLGEMGIDKAYLATKGNPTVSEKVDGSLGILFVRNNEVYVTTRGSFSSVQAGWATTFIRRRGYFSHDFMSGHTYLFEIVYPENRVIVDYGDMRDMVLLAIIENQSGNDVSDNVLFQEGLRLNFSTPRTYHIESIEDAVSIANVPGVEGIVLKYDDGTRVKIKGDDYIRLHRLINGITERRVFEVVSMGASLSDFPDEFFAWAKELERHYNEEHAKIMNRAYGVYNETVRMSSRSEKAKYILGVASDISSVVFAIMDNKDSGREAWRVLKKHISLDKKQEI